MRAELRGLVSFGVSYCVTRHSPAGCASGPFNTNDKSGGASRVIRRAADVALDEWRMGASVKYQCLRNWIRNKESPGVSADLRTA